METVRLSKKEQAEIGNRTKVGNNKDIIRTKPDYPKSKEKRMAEEKKETKYGKQRNVI